MRGTFDPHVATKHLKDHEEERNEADWEGTEKRRKGREQKEKAERDMYIQLENVI